MNLTQLIQRLGTGTLVLLALIGVGYLALVAGTFTLSVWLFALGAVLAYGADAFVQATSHDLGKYLTQFRLGGTTRALLRQLLVVGFVGLLASPSVAGFWWMVGGAVALFTLQTGYDLMLRRLRRVRQLPVVTRNIDLGPLNIPDGPPNWLARNGMNRVLLLDAPLVAGGIGFAATHDPVYAAGGALLSVAGILVAAVVLAPFLLSSNRIPGTGKVLKYVQQWLREYRPEVILYFSGSADSAYQINMWLDSVAKLPRRSLIVLRERAVAANLGLTSIPVLCVPKANDLMALDFEPAGVCLYAANTGKNIHMLRNPKIKHVFIGHGDSDKIASVNPYSKVYDEVWTAGQAGRDRYRVAQVGVRDDEIVEVGRPQLDPIRVGPTDNRVRTVLYAPTWEGWTDDPGNTSLMAAGPTLIAKLLEVPGIRVMYKPHPFTGIRDPRARAAHHRITALINEANQRAGYPSGTEEARRRLAQLEKRLAEVGTFDERVDEAQRSRDNGRLDPALLDELNRLVEEWHQVYWADQGEQRHLVIQGPRPTLYSCFNRSDLLISDISSVVADFIFSGKPYAITNCVGISDEQFRIENPTAGAAYLLRPDGTGLEQALEAMENPLSDAFAEERRKLKTYLLGPDEPPSQVRFAQAVDDLYERAREAVARREKSSVTL
ncbi:glycerophosphotransferase [Thermobifida cellulosilytica]|uniref:glycerophosphotransferase n=1 Tax=Thermobifida cellulosilytica TaxID=144786 RepID=UPI000837AD57|nr:glycerophosphotransferase [Thermobifida cellulosilytica]